MRNDLYVFSHIPKTAGAYFANNIRLSHDSAFSFNTSFTYAGGFINQHTKKLEFYQGKQSFMEYVASLSHEQKNRIHLVLGHDAYHGIHTLLDRPAKYMTFIREPVGRTLSLYNFERNGWNGYQYEIGSNPQQLSMRRRRADHFLVDGQMPDFETWLERGYNNKGHIFHLTMTNYLQYLGFIDEKRDQSSIQDALKQFHFVGITESFDIDSNYIYGLFRSKSSMGNRNISPSFVTKKDLSPSVIQKIKDLNQDDMLLYECALRENAAFKKNTKDFYIKVKESNRRRRINYPFAWSRMVLKDLLRPVIRPILVRLGLRA